MYINKHIAQSLIKKIKGVLEHERIKWRREKNDHFEQSTLSV